ncbi:MAG: isochorismatase family protein [Opitutus sp.]|nr:isochorismatase family protein [Opitutus sp.]
MFSPTQSTPTLPAMTTPATLGGALLLCIDLQPIFVRAMTDGAGVQRRCAFAVAAASGLHLPVAFTEQVPQKLGPTAPELTALAPTAPVFGKITFSALADHGIRDALLHERGVEHLLLCGIETPVCVYQTAVDALAAGLRVTVLSDAVGARRPADADACLATLRHAGAHVLPAETVFYALLHDAKHPFFKAYTELVKSHA